MPELSGLTGNQVRKFRDHFEEGQMVFGRRIAVSQGVIHRIEKKGDESIVSPETLLLRRMAADIGFSFGDDE